MRVEEWLPDFLMQHMERHSGPAWPDLGSDRFIDLAKLWNHHFILNGITPEVAEEASYGLAGLAHKPGDHLAAFLGVCREIVQARAVGSRGTEADPLKAATQASANCPECGGSGWTVRTVDESMTDRLRTAQGRPVPVGVSVAMPCGCELGRHIAQASGLRLTADRYPVDSLRPVIRTEQEEDRLRAAWEALDEETREEYRDYMRAIYPKYLCQFRWWVEGMARYCWADIVKGTGYRVEWFPPDEVPGQPAVTGPISLRSYLAEAPADPVIERERARKVPEPRSYDIPEDDAIDGWF